MKPGRFISLEGIEGVGKSTQAKRLVDFLQQHHIDVIATREPGGTELGEALRSVLLQHFKHPMVPRAELLLMFAARAQHLEEVIKPALSAGKWVVCDRFIDASYAYQGGGRGIALKDLQILEDWCVSTTEPDLTLLLNAPVQLSLGRIKRRANADRIESEELSFFQRVHDAYLAQAKAHPERIRVIDATQSLNQVTDSILKVVSEHCGIPLAEKHI
jgi:dTMP kinase